MFLREAAGEISSDLDNTLRAEKNFAWVEGEGNTAVQGLMVTGNKRYTSEAVAYLKDSFGMSYAQIEKAVQDYLEGGEAMNSTDCKKLEFVLDELLSRDHDAFGSTGTVYANEAYIAAKQTIPGAEVRETWVSTEDDGMDELPFALGGRDYNASVAVDQLENSVTLTDGTRVQPPEGMSAEDFNGTKSLKKLGIEVEGSEPVISANTARSATPPRPRRWRDRSMLRHRVPKPPR